MKANDLMSESIRDSANLLKSMTEEMSDEELRQTYDMIQKMIKMKRGN